jgi:hypothetical protein
MRRAYRWMLHACFARRVAVNEVTLCNAVAVVSAIAMDGISLAAAE